MRLTAVAVLGALILVVLQTAFFPFLQLGCLRIDGLCTLIAWLGTTAPFSPASAAGGLAVAVMAAMSTSVTWKAVVPAYLIGLGAASYMGINIIDITYQQKILIAGFISLLVNSVMLTGSGSLDLVWPWGILQALVNLVTAPLFLFMFDKMVAVSRRLIPERKSGSDGQEAI